ncbi:hypothetical protein BH09PAT4_BH09PAT4_04590 [soil metagenome]
MTELQVRNCGECPFVLQCETQLQKSHDTKQAIMQMAVGDVLDSEVAPAISEMLQSMPELAEDILPDYQNEQDVAAALRKGAASVLERMDEQDESILSVANLGTLACNGPLKMRASKGNVTTTVTVCNNPLLGEGSQMEDVVVSRSPRQ